MLNPTKVDGFAVESNASASALHFFAKIVANYVVEELKTSQPPQPPQPAAPPKDWVTREEVLCLLDTTNPTLNKWVKNGKITRKYVENKPFYSLNSFYKYLDTQ